MPNHEMIARNPSFLQNGEFIELSHKFVKINK